MLRGKMQAELESLDSLRQFVAKTEGNFDRYLQDVNSHYEGIMNELPMESFNDVMSRYFYKIEEYESSLQGVRDRALESMAVAIDSDSPKADFEEFLAGICGLTNVQRSLVLD
jgi:hypothetical protein